MRRLLAVLTVGLLLYGCIGGDGLQYADFAKCLTNKSIKMYGAYWCGHCNSQKAAFGKSWQHVTYVECAVQGDPNAEVAACEEAGIRGYPTWLFPDGTRMEGEMTFTELSEKSGCALPSPSG